jgi:hypothetical protein
MATMLDHLVGLVKVRVLRGVNLAIRDLCSSDPYVIVRIGRQVCSAPLHPSVSLLSRRLVSSRGLIFPSKDSCDTVLRFEKIESCQFGWNALFYFGVVARFSMSCFT